MPLRVALTLFIVSTGFAESLQVQVVRGEGANNASTRGGQSPAVRVLGGGGPVKGAVVIFSAPTSGSSVDFGGNGPIAQAQTDASGVAVAPSLRPSGGNGPVDIRVLAEHNGETATSIVHQMNLGFLGSEQEEELEIVALPQGGAPVKKGARKFRVRVLDAEGHPVAGARLVLEIRTNRSGRTEEPGTDTHISGPEGTVEFSVNVRPGDVDLLVRAKANGLNATRLFAFEP
jgi:hypothetical protein